MTIEKEGHVVLVYCLLRRLVACFFVKINCVLSYKSFVCRMYKLSNRCFKKYVITDKSACNMKQGKSILQYICVEDLFGNNKRNHPFHYHFFDENI